MGQPRHQPLGWNTFMACKRDFYYKYILRLHEQDEFEDEMTASTFGTIVHKVLEDGFNGLKNRVLQTEDLERLMKNIPPLLQASVAEEYSLALTESGENYLHFAIAEATLRKLISVELKELRGDQVRTVTAVEADLNHAFGIESSPFATVRLHGKADESTSKAAKWWSPTTRPVPSKNRNWPSKAIGSNGWPKASHPRPCSS